MKPVVVDPRSMQVWLTSVRDHVMARAPDILELLDLYIAEAQFGRQYIERDLAGLEKDADILEVGAGSLMLSCQLVREGYKVSALEPIGDGFSHFSRLRSLVLETAQMQTCVPTMLSFPAEELTLKHSFDFAFSINVMEHVNDVARVIENVSNSLRPCGRYRFTCPNYLFPYEPHFNIPTLFSKLLTERVLSEKIFTRQDVPDPIGTWKSLNWITVPMIRRVVVQLNGLDVRFNRELLVSTIGRVATDPQFSARRSGLMRTILVPLVKCKVHLLFGLIPSIFQPIIDCCITKVKIGEAE